MSSSSNYLHKMKIRILLLLLGTLFICEVTSVQNDHGNEIQNHNSSSSRVSKLLMQISVPPTPCGSQNDGVCLPRRVCGRRGGQISPGSCRNGFGECCLFTAMCDATTSAVDLTQHVTTITSPKPITTSCSFRIKKQTKVCQVMLQFVDYISAGADNNGICSTDSFSIRGSITVDEGFTTCGTLTGQHMYLGFGNADTIQIRPSFTQNAGGGYKIVVTQIPCSSAMRVPDYCLQHFRETTGQVTSFDYPNQQQSRQFYTACVGGLTAPSRISWKRCEPSVGGLERDTFFISGGGPGGASNCDIGSDWVQINGRNRRCEFPSLPATIQSRVSPFTLNVNFNENERIEFPIPEELRNLDENTCGTVGMVGGIRPDLKDVISCLWQLPVAPTNRGVCVCTIATNFIAFFGESDFGNTGFCLEYTQT